MHRYFVLIAFTAACSQHTAPEAAPVAEAPAVEEAHSGEEASEAQAKPALPTLPAEGWGEYGEAIAEGDVLPLATLLAAPQDYVDQTLVVEGKVTDVCQKAACWLVLEHEGQTMRVLMKDHGFAVAVDGTGGVSQVYGTLKAVEIDPEFVEHLESESANVEAMPEKQAQGNTTYQLEALGVRMTRAAG